jgi:hypothetical protein
VLGVVGLCLLASASWQAPRGDRCTSPQRGDCDCDRPGDRGS